MHKVVYCCEVIPKFLYARLRTEEQGGEGQTKNEHTNTEGRIGRIALARSTKPIVAKWKGVISLPQLA